MRFLIIGMLLALSLPVLGQERKSPIRIGLAAGVNRNTLNTFQHATNGESESLQAEGSFGVVAGVYAQKKMAEHLNVYLAPKFRYNRFSGSLGQTIPEYAVIRHEWDIKQAVYSATLGATYTVLAGGNKQLYLKAGLVSSWESRTVLYNGVGFSFTSNKYDGIYAMMDYTPGTDPKWILGSDAGIGLRLYDGVDLTVGYTLNFTNSRILVYTAAFGSKQGASDVRSTTGALNSRNNYVSAEVIFWLNK